jgi:endonuclease/exonuclease/phosphatase family metal-dependent hydrolase
MARPDADVVVATFNMHSGIDGWGRPYDIVGACRSFDADVLVLPEDWVLESGGSLADGIGKALGYEVAAQGMTTGRRAVPHPQADGQWKPAHERSPEDHVYFLDGEVPLPPGSTESTRYLEAQPGELRLAVLSRLPVTGTEVIDLGRRRTDRCRRVAVVVQVDVSGRPLTVVGAHMPHPKQWAPASFGALRRALRQRVGEGAAVLAGDMNLWGPPLSLLLPGWRRVVFGRTWPAWRPHSQIDHILVRGPVEAEGEVLPNVGSDHLPIRARLSLLGA